jgi:hypothetical protein
MLTSINNIVLDFRGKHDKISTEASHPDYQVHVLLWVYFGITQLFGIHHVILDMLPPVPEKGIG